MMAMSEEQGPRPSGKLAAAVLRLLGSIVLGFVAVYGFTQLAIVVTVLTKAGLLLGPVAWVTTGRLVAYLLIFLAAIAGVLWLRPWRAVMAMRGNAGDEGPVALETKVMAILLLMMALFGFAAAAGMIAGMLFNPRVTRPVNGLAWTITWSNLALFLTVGGGGLWGLVRLKPWAKKEPLSPATRKTEALFGIGGLIATASCLAVIVAGWMQGGVAGPISNSPLPLWVAIFAIVTWLLSWAISGWWYASADEHEKRASDVGLLVGGFLFALVTPAWWVAARAGLVPQPDAMILWLIVNFAWGIGWFWRRNR